MRVTDAREIAIEVVELTGGRVVAALSQRVGAPCHQVADLLLGAALAEHFVLLQRIAQHVEHHEATARPVTDRTDRRRARPLKGSGPVAPIARSGTEGRGGAAHGAPRSAARKFASSSATPTPIAAL